MDACAALVRMVEQALATGRLGQPVAGRLIAQVLDQPDDISLLLPRLLETARGWLGGSIRTLYAQGNVSGGEMSVLARFEAGQSLLLSVGRCLRDSPVMEATLWGSQGALSCSQPADRRLTRLPRIEWTLTEPERRWAQCIRRSQQLRAAVAVNEPDPADSSTGSVHCLELPAARFPLQRRETRPAVAPPYGVLLVAGDHTHQPGYAEGLASDPRCRLVGLTDEADVSPARRALNQRLAGRLGFDLLPDLSSALQRSDVQIVSICAEPERRARIILQAASAGKHLYLDKPLCASVGEAAAIVRGVRDAKVLGHMFTQVHWEPAVGARQVVESGELGEIRAVHCDVTFAKGHIGTAVLGRSRVEQPVPEQFELPDAKRELTNIGVYGVVMLLWLLRRQVRRVFAATENFFFAEHQQRNMEDFGQMLLELDGGITASLTAARCGWRSHPAGGMHRVCLVGTKGTVLVDAYRQRAEIWSNEASWLPPPRDPDDPLAMWAPLPDSPYRATPKRDWIAPTTPAWTDDTRHFLDCLQHGRDSEVPVELAAAATETLMAAYQSAASHRVAALS